MVATCEAGTVGGATDIAWTIAPRRANLRRINVDFDRFQLNDDEVLVVRTPGESCVPHTHASHRRGGGQDANGRCEEIFAGQLATGELTAGGAAQVANRQ